MTDHWDALSREQHGGPRSPQPPAAGEAADRSRLHTDLPVFLVLIGLFLIAALFAAHRRDVSMSFDELAHISYIAHLQQTGDLWPKFERMLMLDTTFRFTDTHNYLNHPPLYYQVLVLLGPPLEGHPEALTAHRVLNLVFAAVAIAATLALGLSVARTRLETYAYCIPIVCIPFLVQLAGEINNDNLAFAGSAVAVISVYRLLITGRTAWLCVALLGLVIAAYAKFTALLLCGGLVAGTCGYLLWRGRFRYFWAVPIVIAGLAAAMPYGFLLAEYGSPAPTTPGQVELLEYWSRETGLADRPRLSFPTFVASFSVAFGYYWLPTLAPRSVFNYAATVLPIATVVCGLAGLYRSSRRIARREETAVDVIVVVGWVTIAITLVCHVLFSYAHHRAYASVPEGYPRYYLPLAAVVPLACLSLLWDVADTRRRVALTYFFITAPILYILLGSPLGELVPK